MRKFIHKKSKYYVSASFTLEAAITYPFTIVLIFSFIFLAFYIHDKNLAHAKLMKSMYADDISLSGAPSFENIKEYTVYDLGTYTFTEGVFEVNKKDYSDTSYVITTYHNNTFIPYMGSISASYVNFPGTELCRKINSYQSLYLLAKGE